MKIQDDYCLTSGAFQKLCHTTRETLRYYENKGVLVPVRDPENGYKYYSHAQIASFYYIKSLTDLGSTLPEIKDVMTRGDAESFSDFIDSAYMELLNRKDELERKLSLTRSVSYLMNRAAWMKEGVPKISKLSLTMKLRISPITSNHPYSAGEITEDISRYVESCGEAGVEAFPLGASIDKENVLRGHYPYKNLFTISLTDEHVAENEAKESAHELVFSKGTRIVAVTASEGNGDIKEAYRKLVSALQHEGYSMVSDVYSISLINTIRHANERAYYKYIFTAIE